MMKKIFVISSVYMALLFFAGVVGAANETRIAELQKLILQLEAEAEKYRDNIAEERAKAQSLKTEIAALKGEISRLETQITLTAKKIDKTKIEIDDLGTQIADTQTIIDRRRETIGELLVFLSQRDGENILAIMLKNQSLSNFLAQTQQVDNVNTQLLSLIGELRDRKQELEGDRNTLENKERDLVHLNQENAAKKISLLDVKSSRDSLLTKTKGQEAEYQRMLNEVEQRKTQFFIELQKIENQIIAGGTYIVHVTAKNIPPRNTNIFSWPESGYRLTQSYGMTTYARRGAYGGAPHNGIDIANGYGSPIKAIGAGEIVANGFNSGFGNWVAIKHPPYNFVSVYAHMSSLSPLFVGTQITQGQVIGYEGATGNATGPHLHLSLYKDFFTYVNDKKGGQLYFNYFEGSVNPVDYLP